MFLVRGSIDLFFVWVVENDLVLWAVCGRQGASGYIPGFPIGISILGITDVAPCYWEHHPQRYLFSSLLLGNNSHLLNFCVGEGGRLTRVTQRCWLRAELGHLGLPVILQYSRGGTSSKFRGSVEDWMVYFSPSGT